MEIHDLTIQDGIPWVLTEVTIEKEDKRTKITYRWKDYRKDLLRSYFTKINNQYRLLDELVNIEYEKDRFDTVYRSSFQTTKEET